MSRSQKSANRTGTELVPNLIYCCCLPQCRIFLRALAYSMNILGNYMVLMLGSMLFCCQIVWNMDEIAKFQFIVFCINVANWIATTKKRKQKKVWARSWLQRRYEGRGLLRMVHNELRFEDEPAFRNFTRLCGASFDEICGLISESVKRVDTNMRQCISVKDRLDLIQPLWCI